MRAFRGKMRPWPRVRSYLEGVRQSHVVLADSDLHRQHPPPGVYQAIWTPRGGIHASAPAVWTADEVTYFRLDAEGRIH